MVTSIESLDLAAQKRGIDREIRRLAWPAISEMILHMFVWIVDTAMVGRLGAQALSAVGLGGNVYWTCTWICGAIGIGVQAMVARAVGAGDTRRAAFSAGQGLLAGFGLGAVLAGGAMGAAPWVYRLAGFAQDVSVPGIEYMRIVGAGALLFIPLQVGAAILRGSGDTRTPLYVTLVTNSANLVGDYVLIFGVFGLPKLGVRGAALATLIAHVIGGLLTLGAVFRRNGRVRLRARDVLRVDACTLRTLVRLSVPAGVEEALMNGSRLLSSFIIATLGTAAFAANQVTVAAEALSFMPGYGFAMAAGILVGQSLGARRPDLAMQVGYRSLRHSVAVMGSVAVAFLAAPRFIIGVFTDDPEVIYTASVCLRIAAFEQIFIGITDTLCGSLRGAGDTRTALRITAAGTWLVRVPLVVVAVYLLHLGLPAVWAITCLDWAVRAVLAARHFRAGRWQEARVH
ncbi:MAG: MATE family efflux transporter [Firmicutes bacterium]|jgi:putative MATE family efflux protein|nr:MATE family efflux transporter [Bacillota bacterium]MDH7495950.1 MATE family efflux transporter [Bacillota bacterium]